jgi:hypothetical protein
MSVIEKKIIVFVKKTKTMKFLSENSFMDIGDVQYAIAELMKVLRAGSISSSFMANDTLVYYPSLYPG